MGVARKEELQKILIHTWPGLPLHLAGVVTMWSGKWMRLVGGSSALAKALFDSLSEHAAPASQ